MVNQRCPCILKLPNLIIAGLFWGWNRLPACSEPFQYQIYWVKSLIFYVFHHNANTFIFYAQINAQSRCWTARAVKNGYTYKYVKEKGAKSHLWTELNLPLSQSAQPCFMGTLYNCAVLAISLGLHVEFSLNENDCLLTRLDFFFFSQYTVVFPDNSVGKNAVTPDPHAL